MLVLHRLNGLLALCLLPLLTAQAQSKTDDAATAFGRTTALAGHQALIGEPLNDLMPGFVYVFALAGSTEEARLTASNAAPGDRFGTALDVEGDAALIGAPRQNNDEGAAYLFERDPFSPGWIETAMLTPASPSTGSDFGQAVALNGTTAVVGAPRRNTVHVFEKNPDGSWTEQAVLTGSTTAGDDRFGFAVSLAGDFLLVGAYQHSPSGIAYVFQKNPDGSWVEHSTLEGTGLTNNARFGYALALQDNEAVIGAYQHNNAVGTVFVYGYDDGTEKWTATDQWEPSQVNAGESLLFGRNIHIQGDQAAVGALFADGGRGRAYLYRRDTADGTWQEQGLLTAGDAEPRDFFGWSVSIQEGLALVGAASADIGQGNAYLFEFDPTSEMWLEANRFQGDRSGLPAITGTRIACTDGQADIYTCSGIDLLSFLPTTQMGGIPGVRVNDIWGWTDPDTGTPYAIVGREDGTAFVDVSDPLNPVYLGNLFLHTGNNPSVWRDIKVYANHAFIVADGAPSHGMQVFDLTQLRDVTNPPVEFSETTHYAEFGSAHNIAINEESGFAYAVGVGNGNIVCNSGLHMINIQNPLNPTFAGCFAHNGTGRSGTGYTHDAQCVIYQGPDVDHQGKEVCFSANETHISVADVTDKENPVALGAGTYPTASYIHQGWLTEDHRYFYSDDELDETGGLAPKTTTFIWDVSDLDQPVLAGQYEGVATSTDHNMYVVGDALLQSNYASGLRILNISTRDQPREVGFFDTFPTHDSPGFSGSWSNYPFYGNEVVAVTNRESGLFLLNVNGLFAVANEPTDVPDAALNLSAAYPNPFSASTSVTLQVDTSQDVRIAVYDLLGRPVYDLHNGPLRAGTHTLSWPANALAAGTYVIRAIGTNVQYSRLVTKVN